MNTIADAVNSALTNDQILGIIILSLILRAVVSLAACAFVVFVIKGK